MASSTTITLLTQKLYDSDSDIRYMSLNDLINQFLSTATSSITVDYIQSAKVADGLLHTLNDANGEVQNLTIKALGPFVLKAHADLLPTFILKLTELSTADSLDSSLSALAARAIVTSLPRPSLSSGPRPKSVELAYNAVSQVIIPRLVGYYPAGSKANRNAQVSADAKGLLMDDLETGRDSFYIDVVTEIARCYGPMLSTEEVDALQTIVLKLLESTKTSNVLKKKATQALSILSVYFTDALLSNVLSHMIEAFRNTHLTPQNRRVYITALGAMSKAIPAKFGPNIRTLAPFVLSPLSQQELDEEMEEGMDDDHERDPALDETREAALQTVETFLVSCPEHLQAYYSDMLSGLLRYIKYDPNFIVFDDGEDVDQDEDDVDFEVDDDFEEEGGIDDDDDMSWKVRRCAAKALHAMIAIRGNELLQDTEAYGRVSHMLVDRFKEREEGVRLEVLSTLAFLIRKTAEFEGVPNHQDPALSSAVSDNLKRKRARRTSDVSMVDAVKYQRLTGSMSPDERLHGSGGPLGRLAAVGPEIVSGSLLLLKTGGLSTKQAVLMLLQDYITSRQGSLSGHLEELLPMLVDILKTSNKDTQMTASFATGVKNASNASIQIEAFRLLSEICKTHSSTEISPKLRLVVPEVSIAVKSKAPKTGAEALQLMEQLVKTITPPRTAAGDDDSSYQAAQILQVATEAMSARSTDSLVRNKATHVVAIILGRTATAQGGIMVSDTARAHAFGLLLDAIQNEISRFAAIKAIGALGSLLPPGAGLDPTWTASVSIALGNQLRKADRSLRGAALQALQTLLAEKQCCKILSLDAAKEVAGMLVPLLTSQDLLLIGSALTTLSALIYYFKSGVNSHELVHGVGEVVASSLAAGVVDELAELIEAMGAARVGKDLMALLLRDISLRGTASIVGKLIGDLLVSGGESVGVNIDAFHNELQTQQDDKRKCLALSVLGEYGLRSGSASASSLPPALFTEYFQSLSPDVSLAAAIALGRIAAGEGNAKNYIPVILSFSSKQKETQQLTLYAIKEVVTHTRSSHELDPFLGGLWNLSISSSDTEESRTIGAECLAALVNMQSKPYLQNLHALLSADKNSTRGTAILAFRDVFAGSESSYDKNLRPIVIDVLTAMMRDTDLDNRRSALNTFNAAAKNKADLIMPYLAQLLPLVIDQTLVDQGLIREVQMGPFKHQVDDGLECRKGAYETIYSLTESASSRIHLPRMYDRVVAGLGDEYSIRSLCALLITKFLVAAPEETILRLDAISVKLKEILATTLKETAVRHEHERLGEAKRSAIRLALDLNTAFPGEAGVKTEWSSLLVEIRTPDLAKMTEEIERDMKERERV